MTRKTLCIALVGLLAGCLAAGCVIKDDPCDGVTCSGFGDCLEDANGDAVCDCDPDYHADLLQCIFDGYQVSLEWTFGDNAGSCTEVLVTNVVVQLIQNDEVLVEETVNCSRGGAEIEGVNDGSYSIYLLGRNNDNEEWYRAYVDFSVAGFDENLGTINLDAFGFMEFTWVFGQEEWDCFTAGVDRVRVEIYTTDETTNLFTASQ